MLAEWPCDDLPAVVSGGPWLKVEGTFDMDTDSFDGPDYVGFVMLRLAAPEVIDPVPVVIVPVRHA